MEYEKREVTRESVVDIEVVIDLIIEREAGVKMSGFSFYIILLWKFGSMFIQSNNNN